MPPPSQMKMQASALPFTEAPRESCEPARAAAVVARNWRRFISGGSRFPDEFRQVEHGPDEILVRLAPLFLQARIGHIAGTGALFLLVLNRGRLGREVIRPRDARQA